jgi:hypothetical protein
MELDLRLAKLNPAEAPPCRLHVILAREAPVGVIFRRGPSKWVQILRWDTEADTFTPGQWFHGRIYERECDLSPDGRLLLYVATDHKYLRASSYDNNWTAVSKLPYLTALGLWRVVCSGHGGGLFLSNTEIWLNHHDYEREHHPNHAPQGLTITFEVGTIEQRRFDRGWLAYRSPGTAGL